MQGVCGFEETGSNGLDWNLRMCRSSRLNSSDGRKKNAKENGHDDRRKNDLSKSSEMEKRA